MIIDLKNKKYDEEKINKVIKTVIITMYIFIFISIINLIVFKNINENIVISFLSKQTTEIVPILAVVSCLMYYYTYKKDTLFIIMLIYLSITFEYLYINFINIQPEGWKIIIVSFLLLPYLFRTFYITLMVMGSNSISKWIVNRKKTSIILTILITKIFVDINLYLFGSLPTSINLKVVILFNIILIIYHFVIITIMAYKSLKENELIYAVIMVSINFFIIKRAYSYLYFIIGNEVALNQWCNALVFMGNSIIILGIFLELTLTLNQTNRLQRELKIFYFQAEHDYNSYICIYNKKSEIIYANKKTREYYNVNEDKAGYESLLNKFCMNISEDQQHIIKELSKHKGDNWKGNIFLNDGMIIETNIQTIIVGNKELYTVVISKDITDDYNIAHQLELNEKRLRLITENIEDLIFTVDIYGKITYVNGAVSKTINYNSKEMIDSLYLNIISEKYRDSISIAVTENNYNLTLEHEIIGKNNEIILVESVISTIKNFYEEPIGKVIVSRDLKQRKEIENLKIKVEEVKQYEQIKNEFFANLSHELRTPINIIYSCIQLLEYKKKNEEEQFLEYYGKYQKTMTQNCFRMLRLVNNLIDITKIDSGFIKMEFGNYNIINLVENITMSIIPYVEAKKVNIIFDTEEEDVEIRCDPDKIERVILNLLSNAVKFTDVNGNIEVNIAVTTEWVEISVKDDGIGIPTHMKEFIFERFVQTDKSLNRAKEGSGIGLALVKSLVELHDGKVYLNSECQQGCKFVVLLPNKKENNSIIKQKDIEYKYTVERISIEFADIYDLN